MDNQTPHINGSNSSTHKCLQFGTKFLISWPNFGKSSNVKKVVPAIIIPHACFPLQVQVVLWQQGHREMMLGVLCCCFVVYIVYCLLW